MTAKTNEQMPELLPCPFCGEDVEIVNSCCRDGADFVRHKNGKCLISLDSFNIDSGNLANTWNTRVPHQQPGAGMAVPDELPERSICHLMYRHGWNDCCRAMRSQAQGLLKTPDAIVRSDHGADCRKCKPCCGNPESEHAHYCPYQYEINDNGSDDYCNCCDSCMDNCRGDV